LEKDHFWGYRRKGRNGEKLVLSCFVFMNKLMISPSIDENQEVLK